MKKYIIRSITTHDGQPRTDGRYPSRVGSKIRFVYDPIIGCPILWEYLEDAAGNPKDGHLSTSSIKEISKQNNGRLYIIKTNNSVYYIEDTGEETT